MKLYLLIQNYNKGYDTYDSCVVVAENEEDAKRISPDEYREFIDGDWAFVYQDGRWERDGYGSWAPIEYVQAIHIGIAAPELEPGTVVCASFNAG